MTKTKTHAAGSVNGLEEQEQASAQAAAQTGQESEIDELRRRLAEKEQEARENFDRYLRTVADFDNSRKRIQQQKEDAIEFANSSLILQVLPVLDNFDLAIQHAESDRDVDRILSGIKQIFKQMKDTLSKQGVEPIEALGKPFNPAEHEAVGQMAKDDYEEGMVAQDLRTGYRMKGRCIRPSMVRVAGG